MSINNLVTNSNDEAFHDDKAYTGRFTRAGGLMIWTKSDSDNLIKPQGVISKITAREVYNPKDHETTNVLELAPLP